MFEKFKSFRVSEDVQQKIDKLLQKFPDKYSNESHLLRCAIIRLYNKEFKGESSSFI